MSDQRRVQKLINSQWEDINFEDIKTGDIFRLFESTGEPVIGNKNDTEFEAINDAYINQDGIYQVDIKS
jgi:hypothetical protein